MGFFFSFLFLFFSEDLMFNPTTNRSDSIVAYLAFVNQDNKSIEGLGLKVYGTIEDLSPQHDKLFVHIWNMCAHIAWRLQWQQKPQYQVISLDVSGEGCVMLRGIRCVCHHRKEGSWSNFFQLTILFQSFNSFSIPPGESAVGPCVCWLALHVCKVRGWQTEQQYM